MLPDISLLLPVKFPGVPVQDVASGGEDQVSVANLPWNIDGGSNEISIVAELAETVTLISSNPVAPKLSVAVRRKT